MAKTGPIPIILGSTPATAAPIILANGLKACFLTASPEANNKAAAPSFNPDAFPAVTEPSFLNAGLKLDNDSNVVSGLANSSFSKIIGSFFF